MSTDELEKKIRELMKAGFGYRRIAKQLGVSQYRVRTIIRNLVIDKTTTSVPREVKVGRLPLKKVKTAQVALKKAIVLSDIHIPYHCRKSLAIAIAYTKDVNPDTIILNGDIIDMYAVSRYVKDPMRIESLQAELDQARNFLDTLRKNHPKADITYIKGNHEARLEKFLIDRAPDLMSLRCLSLDNLLSLSKNKIKFIDTGVWLGDLYIEHGALSRVTPGATALAYYRKMACSVLVGHVHKLNVARHKNHFGIHTLVENGCLSSVDFDYLSLPANWQQGFTEVWYEKSGRFQVFQHCIQNGELVVRDKVYKAGK